VKYYNLLSTRVFLLPIFSIFLITFLLVSSQSVYADTIFVDTFDKDPQANGWTEKMVQVQGNSKYPSTAVGEISPTGKGEVVLQKTGGASGLELSITRTIDTTGFKNIELDLIAKQSSGKYENEDLFRIEYNSGTGIKTLYEGHGNSILASTNNLNLSSDADENSSLMVRLTVLIDEVDERIYLDNFMIKGDVVEDDAPVKEPPAKEEICHKGKTIEVSAKAVDKHIQKHGDTEGPCTGEEPKEKKVKEPKEKKVKEPKEKKPK